MLNDIYVSDACSSPSERLAVSRTVAADAMVSEASSFADPIWYAHSLMTLPGMSPSAESWDNRAVSGFPSGFSLGIAEYAYHRLHKPVKSHDRQGSWLTVINELYILKGFAKFCDALGLRSFSEVELGVFESYHEALTSGSGDGKAKSKERVDKILATVYRLWEYGGALSEPLRVMPFGRKPDQFRAHVPSRENRTPVIPDAVYAPLMAAALDYVLIYSEYILEAYSRTRSAWTIVDSLSLSFSGKVKKFSRMAEIILSDKRADWRKEGWSSLKNLIEELHQLQRACTMVILAFSGIRLSELLSMEANCCVKDVIDGKDRYYINTRLRKHHGGGRKDTWVVIAEVVQAVEILERLTEEVRNSSQDNRLFLSDGTNSPFFITAQPRSSESVCSAESVTYKCNAFLAQCNSRLDRLSIPPVVGKEGELEDWHLTARQFRRTLARYIARQPFGTIAGMIQYKHVEVTCFEGYAGEDPSWNKLLSEEKVLASVDILEEVAIDLSNGTIAGAVGVQLKRQFEVEFKGRADDFSPSQVIRWLRATQKSVHVAKFNFCLFDKEKAVCTRSSLDKERPIVNACSPISCANCCITSEHAPIWRAQMNQAENLLRNPKCSSLQKMILIEEVAMLADVVNSISPGAA